MESNKSDAMIVLYKHVDSEKLWRELGLKVYLQVL